MGDRQIRGECRSWGQKKFNLKKGERRNQKRGTQEQIERENEFG